MDVLLVKPRHGGRRKEGRGGCVPGCAKNPSLRKAVNHAAAADDRVDIDNRLPLHLHDRGKREEVFSFSNISEMMKPRCNAWKGRNGMCAGLYARI